MADLRDDIGKFVFSTQPTPLHKLFLLVAYVPKEFESINLNALQDGTDLQHALASVIILDAIKEITRSLTVPEGQEGDCEAIIERIETVGEEIFDDTRYYDTSLKFQVLMDDIKGSNLDLYKKTVEILLIQDKQELGRYAQDDGGSYIGSVLQGQHTAGEFGGYGSEWAAVILKQTILHSLEYE
jgi:hypothetical protein